MEYFSLSGRNLLTILLPTFWTVSKILTFLYIYYDNKRVRNFFNYGLLIFQVVSGVFFYLNLNIYGEYFCFIWSGTMVIPLIMFNLMYRNKEKDETDSINIFEWIIIICSIAWGIFMLTIPYSRVFTMIGGNYNPNIDRVSRIVFCVYGIVQITFDKPLGIILRRISSSKR